MSYSFTGRHFLLIMVAAFGIIIGVNVAMAIFANKSWTGFVVRNSYVAGLEMNRKLKESHAQAALGWKPMLESNAGNLNLSIRDGSGETIRIAGGTASFRRPVSDLEDVVMTLIPEADGSATAALPPRNGAWIVDIEADAGRETPWRGSHRLFLKDGELR